MEESALSKTHILEAKILLIISCNKGIIGDLIDEYSNLNEIAEKLGEALTAAFGGAKTEQTVTPGEK